MQIEEIKDQICDVCHKMWQLGWVAANDGNVSVRLEDGTFLATPTGMSKSFITPDKLLRIDAKGNVLEGAEGLRPSSEIKMHLRCYEKRADVNAVVHAHPPAATGFAVAHRPMDMYNMIEDVAAIGAVPLTPYGTPSTTEVPDAIEPYLNDHDVMLLENHGALTVGTLDGANVEMHDLLGDENMFLFGLRADEVERLKKEGYVPQRLYNRDPVLHRCLDALRSGFRDGVRYDDLYQRLLFGAGGSPADEYFLLADFQAYCQAEKRMAETYRDQTAWNRMSLHNIARSGVFAADRAVAEYADNIWHVPHK